MPVCTKTDNALDVLNEKISKKILKYIETKIREIVSRQRFRRVYMVNEVFNSSAREIPEDPESPIKSPEYMRNLVQEICEFISSKDSFSIPNNWAAVGK